MRSALSSASTGPLSLSAAVISEWPPTRIFTVASERHGRSPPRFSTMTRKPSSSKKGLCARSAFCTRMRNEASADSNV